MAVNLYLDPYIFACPSIEDGVERVNKYIDNILLWEELRETCWVSMYQIESTIEVLFETNNYPVWPTISAAIRAFGRVDVQPKDVVTLVDALLQRTLSVEDSLVEKDVVLDEIVNIECSPSDHLAERSLPFINAHNQLLMTMAVLCGVDSEIENTKQILATQGVDEDCNCISVVGEARLTADAPALPIPPTYVVNTVFPLCCNINKLCSVVDPVAIWAAGTSSDTTRFAAILTYMYQNNFVAEVNLTIEPRWTFGRKFIATARDLGFLHEERKIRMLLRACAETITKSNMRATHALRVSSGGNADQRKRGSDAAWRRDIDYEYHLHYWETPNGPELASVVVHSDMSIP